MRSKTSFFNKTVFLHDCKRFWPLTAGYTLLWLLILPLSRFTQWNHDRYLSAFNMQSEALNFAAWGGLISAFVTGILFAMATFSYLTNQRATNGLHALPARRETLYVTHYLSGLCSQLVPQLVTVLLTAAVMGSHRALDLRVTGLMLLSLLLPTLFFYSFGVFCMMFTGQILAAPVFYGVLNILVVGVEMLVRGFAGNFLYGWPGSVDPALTVFSPIVRLIENGVRASTSVYTRAADGGLSLTDTGRLHLIGLDWLLIYAAVGLVFAALGLLVYKKRHSEATGTTVAIYWARPVFQYGVAFCAALALGQLIYELFFGQYRSNGEYSLPGTIACMAAAGLIGYFAAEMLLKKSFRVLKTGWRGAVVVTGVLVALGCGMSLDLTGYEGWAPEASEVENVYVECYIYGNGSHINAQVKDENTIRLVTAAHRALVTDKARQQSGAGRELMRGDGAIVDGSFMVYYGLKNGGFARRSYDITLWPAEASDSATPAGALEALYNDPDITLLRALGKYGYNTETDPRNMPDLRFTGGYAMLARYNAGGDIEYGDRQRDLTPAEARAIYDAILRDVAAGRVKGSIFAYEVGYPGELVLYATYAQPKSYGPAARPTQPFDVEEGREGVTFGPDLREGMTDTLAVLRGMGIEIEFWEN